MINNIKQALALKLKSLYSSCTIYDEDIPQNFKKPSFLISVIDHSYNKRLSNTYNSTLSIDIAYFSSKSNTEIKSDCLVVQQNLLRELDLLDSFRILDKHATITDNILHLTLNVRYSEIVNVEEIKIKELEANTSMKEV